MSYITIPILYKDGDDIWSEDTIINTTLVFGMSTTDFNGGPVTRIISSGGCEMLTSLSKDKVLEIIGRPI